jgi:hypothetical protein
MRRYLDDEAGEAFDPEVVEAFLSLSSDAFCLSRPPALAAPLENAIGHASKTPARSGAKGGARRGKRAAWFPR